MPVCASINRDYFYIDVPIKDISTWESLIAIDRKVDSVALSYVQSRNNLRWPNFDACFAPLDYPNRIKQNKLESTSYRMYFYSNSDFKCFEIIGFSRNYKWLLNNALSRSNFEKLDSYIIEPMYIIPLSAYYEFLNKEELATIKIIISKLLVYNLADKIDVAENKIIPYLNLKFKDHLNIHSFKYIGYNSIIQDAYSNLKFYRYPIEGAKPLYFHELSEYTKTFEKETYEDTTYTYERMNTVTSINFSINYSILEPVKGVTENEVFMIVELINRFVGFGFLDMNDCNDRNTKVVWVSKQDYSNTNTTNKLIKSESIDYLWGNRILGKIN
jgi:hypothetical protein